MNQMSSRRPARAGLPREIKTISTATVTHSIAATWKTIQLWHPAADHATPVWALVTEIIILSQFLMSLQESQSRWRLTIVQHTGSVLQRRKPSSSTIAVLWQGVCVTFRVELRTYHQPPNMLYLAPSQVTPTENEDDRHTPPHRYELSYPIQENMRRKRWICKSLLHRFECSDDEDVRGHRQHEHIQSVSRNDSSVALSIRGEWLAGKLC